MLRSTDEANIKIAIEMASGIPTLQAEIDRYLQLYQALFKETKHKKTEKEKIEVLNEMHLILRGKAISALPAAIGRLYHLKGLDLGDNKLKILPDTLTNQKVSVVRLILE